MVVLYFSVFLFSSVFLLNGGDKRQKTYFKALLSFIIRMIHYSFKPCLPKTGVYKNFSIMRSNIYTEYMYISSIAILKITFYLKSQPFIGI